MATEGQIETGPNGERAVFQGGRWVLLPAQATTPARVPGAFIPSRPKPKEAPSGYRYNAAGNLEAIPGGPAIQPDKPNLPTGYRMGQNGVAERIPGLPAEDASAPRDPALTQAIKDLGLDELLASIASARQEIGTGRATGVTGAVLGMFPGTSRNDLMGSIDAIQGAVIMEKLQALKDASKTGASGMGALSEREGARLAASVAALNPNMSADKLLESLATIERHAHMLQAVGAGENPENPDVAKKYGIAVSNPNDDRRAAGIAGANPMNGGGSGGGGPDPTLSRNGTETVTDPALTGANQRVKAMIRAGRSAGEIRAYLDTVQPGLGAKVNHLDQWIAYHNANPTKPIDARIDRVEKPLTPTRSFLNNAAQSSIGAGVMGAADMLTGGTLDNMTDNPALTRAGMAGVADAHPIANGVGQVGGAMLAGLGAEALGGAAGLGRIGATLAGDVLPGAAYGAGSSDDGSRIAGALGGGLAGAIGGVAGRGIGRGISGVVDAGAKRLSDAGVRMTLPQMLGGAWKGAEDRLAGMPGFRGIINGARSRGVEDGNRAVFRQAMVDPAQAYVGDQIGEAGVNQLDDAVGAAYDAALGGKVVQIDPQFTGDWGVLTRQLPDIPRVGNELQASIAQTVGPMFDPSGALTGESMQAIDRGFSQLHKAYADDPLYATHIGPAIDAANDAVTGMFARQTPEVMPAYQAAKASYRNLSTISDAVNSAVNTNGTFTGAQLGTAARANAKKFGSAINAARGNRPFFQIQRDMQNILPSKVPDPGTAGQMVIPGALALAGGVGGGASGAQADGVEGAAAGTGLGVTGGLLAGATLASPYVLRGVIQKALMANRPRALQLTGDIIGQSRLPGALALPLLLPGGQ